MQRTHIIFGLVAAAAFLSALSPAAAALEDDILDFLEEFRKRMCHPIPNLGLPALDPFNLTYYETELNNKYLVDFSGSVEDFSLTGLSDFIVDTLTIQTVPLRRSTIRFTLPLTAFKSLYTAKGSLAYILNLSGDGNAEASAEMFTFSISWILRASINVGIRGLQIEIYLGGLKINFEKLLEEERVNEFVHKLVNEMGVELLDDVWKYEQGTVVDQVETRINNFLGQYTLADIIGWITSGGGGDSEESEPIFEGVEPDCKD